MRTNGFAAISDLQRLPIASYRSVPPLALDQRIASGSDHVNPYSAILPSSKSTPEAFEHRFWRSLRSPHRAQLMRLALELGWDDVHRSLATKRKKGQFESDNSFPNILRSSETLDRQCNRSRP